MRAGTLLLLVCLLATPSSAFAGSEGFSQFTPLGLEELYSNRIRFAHGQPRITVGVMDGQTDLQFGGDASLRLIFDEGGVPKVLYLPAGRSVRVRILDSSPAKVAYWAVVHTRRRHGPVPARVMHRWETAKGKHVLRLFEHGAALSLAGRILDTRLYHLAVGPFTDRPAAEAYLTALGASEDEAEQRFVHEELLALPRGVIGVFDDAGALKYRASDVVAVGPPDGGVTRVNRVEFGRGYTWHGREDRGFRGQLYVVVDARGHLAMVNSIGAESLLAGLVPAEIFANAPMEALRAQAVTARGEIFSKVGHRHLTDPFHLCGEQHCQVYSGVKVENPRTGNAVDHTRGMLAIRPRSKPDGPLELVDSRYSSSCGGFSEGNEIVWGTMPSLSLRPQLDALEADPLWGPFRSGLDEANIRSFLESYPPLACARSNFTKPEKFRWRRKFDARQLRDRLSAYDIGALEKVEIIGRGRGGRVTGVRVHGDRGKVDILRELEVRRLFDNLNSGLFVVDHHHDADGGVHAVEFIGGGWGHGVGMCQIGAIARAERGHSFERILAHYYSGAVVERLY